MKKFKIILAIMIISTLVYLSNSSFIQGAHKDADKSIKRPSVCEDVILSPPPKWVPENDTNHQVLLGV